jgi:DeoR family transcriptional regulator, aga operon transcriptional repressor
MKSPARRHNHILSLLGAQGYVTVTELSQQLHVSEATIRRDLRDLEERHLLFRTHGGANPSSHRVYDQPVSEKAKQHAEEKARIGAAAASLIEHNDSVILGSGTTVNQVAKHMLGKSNLTIVASAMDMAMELLHLSDVQIYMLGGIVRKTSTSVVGPAAETMMRRHSCRKLFLGVDGFDIDHGLTTSNVLEANLNKQMIAAAQETIVVTDSSKFSLRGFCQICSAGDVDKIITDTNVLGLTVRKLEERGLEVIRV